MYTSVYCPHTWYAPILYQRLWTKTGEYLKMYLNTLQKYLNAVYKYSKCI